MRLAAQSGLVVMIGAHAPYKGQVFEASARRHGLQLVKFSEGLPWPGNFREGKLFPALACVQSLPPSVTHVLFADAWDSIALAGEAEILAKFEALANDGKILISGEKHCHPDESLAAFYPLSRTGWRFVNSGGWIGRTQDVQRALEWICRVPHSDDQLAWTLAYLQQVTPILVDDTCAIFQTMRRQTPGELWQAGRRIVNVQTGTMPCIAHWNGVCDNEPLMELQEVFHPGHVRRMPVAMEVLA